MEEIADMDRVCFPDDKPPLMDSPWWIAEVDGAVAGYAGAYPSPLFPGSLYYHRIGALPEYRGRGLHRRLSRAIQKYARRSGYSGIVTDISAASAASINGFTRVGFRAFWPETPWALEYSTYWRWTVEQRRSA
jgi:GNAT superfamily N-acetyltransferase